MSVRSIESCKDLGPSVKITINANEGMLMNVYMNSVKLSVGDLHSADALACTEKWYHSKRLRCTLFFVPWQENEPKCRRRLYFDLEACDGTRLDCCRTKVITANFTWLLWFICEQLLLMAKKTLSYSPDFLVFSSLLHSISPTAYRFLRSHFSMFNTKR